MAIFRMGPWRSFQTANPSDYTPENCPWTYITFESHCPKTGYSRNRYIECDITDRLLRSISHPFTATRANLGFQLGRHKDWTTVDKPWNDDDWSCYLWHVRPVTGIIGPPVSTRPLDILQLPAVHSIVITSALFGSQSQSIPSCILALHSSSRCWVMWTKTSCTISLAFLQVPPRPSTTHSSRLSVNRDKLYSTTSLALIDNHKWSFSLTSLDSEIGCM